MFRYRGVRSVVASSLSCYNFAGSVQVAANIQQDAIRALHNSSIISCSQVRNRDANMVYVLRMSSRILQDESMKSCVFHVRTACKSASRHGCIWPFSWGGIDRIVNDRLNSPKSFFCLGTETCVIHSYANKLLSSALSAASKRKKSSWTKREPATEDQKEEAEQPEPEEKQNKTKALKKVFKEYGAVGVSFHIGISLISLGIFYIFVSSGINMTAVLCKLGFSEAIVQSKMAAGTSTFVLAYAVHKLFAPIRISITLVSVPLIVRYLRKTGLFKSSPPRL